MSAAIEPWQVWWVNFDPVEGREQAGRRPAVVVSSRFHLALANGGVVTVMPLTTRERPGWLHRVRVDLPGKVSWAITEQVRTVAGRRLAGRAPLCRLTDDQVRDVRRVLARMLDV